ncbi:unnamed protein product, partial [Prorocentrum cordatum]
DVLVFLKDKKCDEEVLQSTTKCQQREQAEHQASVVTARPRVENLRKEPKKQDLQLQKIKERREQLLKEEAGLLAAMQDTQKNFAAAEALYVRVHAVGINDVVKVTTAALDPSLHANAEAKAAMEVLAKLQQTVLGLKGAAEKAQGIDMGALSAENFEERAAEFKAAAEALRTAAPEAQEAAKRKLVCWVSACPALVCWVSCGLSF